jgi:hypothetical protein
VVNDHDMAEVQPCGPTDDRTDRAAAFSTGCLAIRVRDALGELF